ncbi:acyl-CoA N-acyltransferase [Flagelloscypha sp. PMI_526]|nr:acyl-CoA N-acyltransferase [Flagelloscypha sp. PMI_526]
MSKVTLRPAVEADMPQVTQILNHYIETTVITFRMEPIEVSLSNSSFQSVKEAGLPYIVATNEENKVLGYTYVSGYRVPSHMGYRHTVEMTIFCHPEARQQGIGASLLRKLIALCQDLKTAEAKEYIQGNVEHPGIKQILAVMAVDEDGPEKGMGLANWYTRFGFKQVARLEKVGNKHGKWIDTVFMQLSL